MKCLKCGQGELKPIKKNGKGYAQCSSCGAIFTAHDLKNHSLQAHSSNPTQIEAKAAAHEKGKDGGLGKVSAVTGWILCALFLMFGLTCNGLSLLAFLAAAVLVSPIFRNRVYLSRKIWIPLVIVLFFSGCCLSPQTDAEPKKNADMQESVASAKKQTKTSAEKQDKKDSGKEKTEKEDQGQTKRKKRVRTAQKQADQEKTAQEQAEQERIAQEQAAAQAEQQRIAQEQAAQAEQQRIAQEQAAQAEQQRIAQEQAAQAEQQRIAQEQAAQAEQQRIAQEQAAQAEQQRIAQEQAAIQAAQTSNVWLSATGSKYHSIPNCGRMNPDNARQVTLAEAQQMGIEACKNCH